MKIFLAALTLLVALSSSVWAFEFIDQWGIRAQPDGTTFEVHFYGDKMFVDGYVIVRGGGGWYYYAELDARGEYEASPYKVGIDDPAEIGIPKNLHRQRSAVRQAEIDAEAIYQSGLGQILTQPDGTTFLAYWDQPLPYRYGFYTEGEVPADGYVIAIRGTLLINYRDRNPFPNEPEEPFWAFVYDEESGWYYYASCSPFQKGSCQQTAGGDYVASPYKVGIDDPPGYNPAVTPGRSSPTAVQERSWGAVKHRFHK